jgi:hypothetical protein
MNERFMRMPQLVAAMSINIVRADGASMFFMNLVEGGAGEAKRQAGEWPRKHEERTWGEAQEKPEPGQLAQIRAENHRG